MNSLQRGQSTRVWDSVYLCATTTRNAMRRWKSFEDGRPVNANGYLSSPEVTRCLDYIVHMAQWLN